MDNVGIMVCLKQEPIKRNIESISVKNYSILERTVEKTNIIIIFDENKQIKF